MNDAMNKELPTRSEVQAAYEAEVASIRASGETHPQAISMAMNEARRWLDQALDTALPDTDDVRSLGARLKENIQRKEEAQRLEVLRRLREEERKKSEHREKCLAWFDGWAARVSDTIASGGIPESTRLPRLLAGRESWKMNISNPGHDDHWLWRENILPWATKEGLCLKLVHDHDGMGMESWWDLSVRPA